MIYRILIIFCFLGFSAKGATASLSLSKFIDKDLHSIHAFSEDDSPPNFKEDSIRTKDTLNGRNSSIKKLSLILAVSPWSMLYIPFGLEGTVSYKFNKVFYFAEFTYASILRNYKISRSLGIGIGIDSKSHKSSILLSAGIANRKTNFFSDRSYFGNSFFVYSTFSFKLPLFYKRMLFGCGLTLSSFLFDPYFDLIHNRSDWSWEDAEAANYYYRRLKMILSPNISLGFRIY
jgi:hypothetical protein